MRRELLIEIGTEELPPKALTQLRDAFATELRQGLEQAGLGHGAIEAFATPRRLALHVAALEERTPDRQVERRGPSLAAAFDEAGNPTKAALGFARSCGVEVEQLEKMETGKGSWLCHRYTEPGRPARELLPGIVEQALERLPIPKRMRWGELEQGFVRPVHWLTLLFGEEVIGMELFGLASGRLSFGHRFHHPAALEIGNPGQYQELLERAKVLASFERRRDRIRAQVQAAAGEEGRTVIEEALLDEVTALTEWPVAMRGDFDARFLELPPEVLIASMRGHQKYFHVVDGQGELLPHFVFVANLESREPEAVRRGNERVLTPRLEDASFFWEQDRKVPLAGRRQALHGVVFQKKLGTLADKSDRVTALAASIAEQLGGNVVLAMRAGELCKCDLLTDMVGEFPELQGTMGRYYALHDGEPEEVAVALEEQYLPRHAGDALPQSVTGRALGLADRIDTLVGIFGIGLAPTGDRDPFGLRRAALGVLRILIECELPLELPPLLQGAATQLGSRLEDGEAPARVMTFMMERLRGYYAEQGIAADSLAAVLALQPASPLDLHRRLLAVETFRRLPEAGSLAAANKRIANILRQAGETVEPTCDPRALVEPEEKSLLERVRAIESETAPLLEAGDYEGALRAMAALRPEVDAFFDRVMVMAEDPALRRNRLGLLRSIADLFLKVADLSRLQE